MKYKRLYKIEGKIIEKKDIINMVESILGKYSKEKETSMSIEAKFKDGIILSDNSTLLFDHVYFEKLVLKEIAIHIRQNYSNEVDMYIYSDSTYSSITIESDDNNLYNSICYCVEENINLMKKQNKIYLLSSNSLGYLTIIILALMFEVLIILVMEYLFKIKIPSVLIYLMLLFLPSIIANYTEKYIEKHFPINQFYFGETSINRPITEKGFIYKLVSFVIINIVLPIIITYLTK